MASIYEYTNYRKYIEDRFQAMPKRGYGQARRLAEFLSVHTTLVSQVLKGHKTFTMEQASSAAEFLGLNDLETEYFLALVQYDRAGNESLRRNVKKQLLHLQEKSKELVNRLQSHRKLTDQQRATFYSNWLYSAMRQMTAISGFYSVDLLAEHFGISRKRAKEITEFLLTTGLCIEEKGKLKVGPSTTHIESSSPWVRMHHMNWRQKGLELLEKDAASKLYYTSPMTLSKADALKIRELITQFLERIDKVIDDSPSEELHCLNIDWFPVK